MKHTPGPWRIGKNYGAVVADVPTPEALPGSDHVEAYGGHLIAESISPSNMPIIAAAPEMLEALKNAERALSAAHFAGTSLYAAPVTQAVRAAIAKATGGAL